MEKSKNRKCQTCEGEIVGGPHCRINVKCRACSNCVCPDCHGCDDYHCECGLDDSSNSSTDSNDVVASTRINKSDSYEEESFSSSN